MMTREFLPNTKKLSEIRLLIVEDEYILALNLQESLESLGYTVLDIVDSAEMAIEIAAQQRPSLVLMDIRLRGEMDGIQAAEHIWRQFQIPVVYVTGHSDKSTVERATLTFPFGYILKPVREKELYVAIQTALNRYEREQFFSTVLQGMADGVIVVDIQLHIKYFNPVAEILTGWQLDEVRNQPVTEVVHFIDERTHEAVENPILSALQQNTTVYLNGHTLLKSRDGKTIPVADSAAPIRNNKGEITGIVLVFRDDTQRRLMEERNLAIERTQQIEAQLKETQRLQDLKDEFLATTSHELRTPLSNIKLAIQMLETVLDQQGLLDLERFAKAESMNRYLTILRDQCEQELRMVNDLLDMRSLGAGAYPLEPTSIQLQVWLPHISESFQERAAVQQQTLQITVSPDLPVVVSDISIMTRIMTELLNNACKYTPAHEQIQVIVELVDQVQKPVEQIELDTALRQTPLVQIIVRNSGVELTADQLAQVFNPFYRIPARDPWKHGGTGLGLALVKRFVEHLNGEIEVTSSQGWISFVLRLPISV